MSYGTAAGGRSPRAPAKSRPWNLKYTCESLRYQYEHGRITITIPIIIIIIIITITIPIITIIIIIVIVTIPIIIIIIPIIIILTNYIGRCAAAGGRSPRAPAKAAY